MTTAIEKVREMIIEKDAETERLKAIGKMDNDALHELKEWKTDAERYRKLKTQRGAVHLIFRSMETDLCVSIELPIRQCQPDSLDNSLDGPGHFA